MENKSTGKRTAFLVSLAFHVLVGLFLLFFGLTYRPFLGEGGLLVNFGDSDTGLGQEPVRSENEINASIPEQVLASENAARENLTQQYEEAPVIQASDPASITETTERTETRITDKPVQEIVPERTPDPRALFPGRTSSQGTTSGSQGIAGGSGDQGNPGGDPSASSYTGTGRGSGGEGISFDLAGRSAQSLQVPEYRSQTEGRVVVEVVVDKDGRVISATPGVRGSTTTDQRLYNAAERAALDSRFSRSPESPVQRGTITYIFRLMN